MQKPIILICLILLSHFASSQNIYSALHLNENRDYKTARPKKIVETNIFYNPGGKKVNKNVKIFDEAGMLLIEERFDERGKLTAKLTRTNDTARKLNLSRTFERWMHFGYYKETSVYAYDGNNHLISITDKDVNGHLIRQTNLTVNERGHPIELTLLDANGNPFGVETATYLYDRNRVITTVIANDGRTLSTDTILISFIDAYKFPGESDVYNANGDRTKWISRNENGTETRFEEEYEYDRFGNCIENRIYKVTIKGNGKQKREIDRIFRKEYTY